MNELKLINDKMNDGTRNFCLLPQKVTPFRLLWHIVFWRGAFLTAYIPGFSESWIDFRYEGYKFSVNDQFGDFWFFVSDGDCPDDLLYKVMDHFSKVLV